jgi:hypothetical protein
MLAQNFKTPADLGISDREFGALTKVLGMLERGEVRHAPIDFHPSWRDDGNYYEGMKFQGLFNMGSFAASSPCGTACCIAGTCDMLFGTEFSKRFSKGEKRPALHELFASEEMGSRELSDIRPAQAAIALRSFLTHGEARWSEAVA